MVKWRKVTFTEGPYPSYIRTTTGMTSPLWDVRCPIIMLLVTTPTENQSKGGRNFLRSLNPCKVSGRISPVLSVLSLRSVTRHLSKCPTFCPVRNLSIVKAPRGTILCLRRGYRDRRSFRRIKIKIYDQIR